MTALHASAMVLSRTSPGSADPAHRRRQLAATSAK
eukprot:CAMPEP_0178447990 /NCGR_PEP_ID=MMETSP0689_2-20121128/41727_1 /TAXON_ID=160604 /ORGANISM="Amphidinium massartii, Strain CS-259" /LENGTH=34 /DNA_ID= /DNA_START= /DNA_END= /DNA_ORIENTATION=